MYFTLGVHVDGHNGHKFMLTMTLLYVCIRYSDSFFSQNFFNKFAQGSLVSRHKCWNGLRVSPIFYHFPNTQSNLVHKLGMLSWFMGPTLGSLVPEHGAAKFEN